MRDYLWNHVTHVEDGDFLWREKNQHLSVRNSKKKVKEEWKETPWCKGWISIGIREVYAKRCNYYHEWNWSCRAFSVERLPTARKLQPHWDGKWIISKVKGPCNLELTDGHQSKVVHVNHVQHRIQPDQVKGHAITEQ